MRFEWLACALISAAVAFSPAPGRAQSPDPAARNAELQAAVAAARAKALAAGRAEFDQMRAGGAPYLTIGDGAVEFREVQNGPVQKLNTAEFQRFIQQQYEDKTSLSGSNVHGWQVEYTSADGKAFLWYPGNDRLVVGSWRTRIQEVQLAGRSEGRVEICFTYADAYNPATGTGPGDEECQDAVLTMSGLETIERRAGDQFALASGKLPYKRDKADRPAWPTGASQ